MREFSPLPILAWALASLVVVAVSSCERPQKGSDSIDEELSDSSADDAIDLAASWETPRPGDIVPKSAAEAKPEPAPEEGEQKKAPPPKWYRDRADADLLERFEGKTMSEILKALLPPPNEDSVSEASPKDKVVDFDGAELFTLQAVEGLHQEIKDGVIADFDGDSFLDVVALQNDGALKLLVRKDSDAEAIRFELQPDVALDQSRGGDSITAVDFDGDGHSDLMVLRRAGLPSSLLRNDGGGRFKDVTIEVGLLDFREPVECVWADFDGDSRLDLLMANRGAKERCGLFLAEDDGSFEDRSNEWGIAGAGGGLQSVALLDADDDGWLDLLLNGDRKEKNTVVGCYRNHQGAKFERIDLPKKMPAGEMRVADLDEDGREDLLLSDGKYWSWWRNFPAGRDWPKFENVSEASGLEQRQLRTDAPLLVADFDGDGDRDLLGGNPQKLLLNRRGGYFVESSRAGVSMNLGDSFPGWTGIADIDSDGDLDVLNGGQILLGRAAEDSAWVRLQPSAALTGAKVTVTTRDKSWIRRSVHRRLAAGNSSAISIGLGEAERILSVEIRRPGQKEPTETLQEKIPRQTLSLENVADAATNGDG